MSIPRTDVSTLSDGDKKLYAEIENKFLNFKLKKYKVRVIQEARLVHTDVLESREQITDVKEAYAKFMEHLKAGKMMTAMAEMEYIVYVDPDEAATTPETILQSQLLLGDSKAATVKDYRIVGVEYLGETFAHQLMTESKLRDSIENAFLDRVERAKENAKVEKPERMN